MRPAYGEGVVGHQAYDDDAGLDVYVTNGPGHPVWVPDFGRIVIVCMYSV